VLTANSIIARNLGKLVTIIVSSLLILSLTAIAPSTNSVYAMGPPPGGCSSYDPNGREYNAIFNSFKISNGTQTVDVLKGGQMNVDINKGYTITFTLHALNTGTTWSNTDGYKPATFSDSINGSVWLNQNSPRNYSQSSCFRGFTINSDQTMTWPMDYASFTPHFALPDKQDVTFRTTNLTVGYTVTWVNNTAPSSSSQVIVSSQDSSGNTINGYYTVLYQNGAAIDTGFTPASFKTTSGQTYTVEVQDYGSYFFDHWADNGSTNRDRVFTASTSQTTFTAVYRNGQTSPPPPGSGTATFNVKTVDSNGNEIYGYYTTLWQGTQLVKEGFSPVSFNVPAGGGQYYAVTVADYGSYHFDHWSDGDTSRFLSFVPGSGQTISLTAVYRAS